jgi:hypothetical protein
MLTSRKSAAVRAYGARAVCAVRVRCVQCVRCVRVRAVRACGACGACVRWVGCVTWFCIARLHVASFCELRGPRRDFARAEARAHEAIVTDAMPATVKANYTQLTLTPTPPTPTHSHSHSHSLIKKEFTLTRVPSLFHPASPLPTHPGRSTPPAPQSRRGPCKRVQVL